MSLGTLLIALSTVSNSNPPNSIDKVTAYRGA